MGTLHALPQVMFRFTALLSLVCGVAQAEPLSFGGLVTTGIGLGDSHGPDNAMDYKPIAALQLDVGVRARNFMVGAHVGFNSGTPQIDVFQMSMSDAIYHSTLLPMLLGVSGHVVVHDRYYATPWIGVQTGWSRTDCMTSAPTCPPESQPLPWQHGGTQPAFGLGLGVDALEYGAHRISVTAAFDHALADESGRTYTSVWLGVGYRFWDR